MSAVGEGLRRLRAPVLVAALVLAAVTVLTVLTARSTVRGAELDPANPSPNGAQAVARVLAARGVGVTVVRRAAELERVAVDRDTTVLVTSLTNLGRGTARAADRRSTEAGALVLAAPGQPVIRSLRLPVTVLPVRSGERTHARCGDPVLSGLVLEVETAVGYRGTGDADVEACFTGRGADASALVVRVDRRVPTYAVAATDLFTNEHVTRADNAAAALRLLGRYDRLVWYVPDLRDVPSGDPGSLAAQLPGGLYPALGLLAGAVLATMLWRGRRLGPLVVEPLPVAVKAVESTQGRGRLYHRVRDRAHAAAILRESTGRRLGGLLRLPPGADAHGIAEAVGRATGRDPQAVYDVLARRPVADDRALTRLAADLAALEREVHSA